MLRILMFHRLGEGKYSNAPFLFDDYLEFIKGRYPVVLPGDSLESGTDSICLTSDDAMCDFYFYTYPLLKKHNLKALLAVPTHYIIEKTSIEKEKRLAVPYYEAFEGSTFQEKVPFCTWQEIREMVESGHVEVASHSHNHINMIEGEVDMHMELVHSKELLERHLGHFVSTFVYPFGKASKDVDRQVKEEYTYSMRIGSCYNCSWDEKKILCRIPVDNMESSTAPFPFFKDLSYRLKTLLLIFR